MCKSDPEITPEKVEVRKDAIIATGRSTMQIKLITL